MKPFVYIGFIMGGIFVVFGVVTILFPPAELQNKSIPAPILGVLIFVYGGYRVYRSYKLFKKMNEEPPNSDNE